MLFTYLRKLIAMKIPVLLQNPEKSLAKCNITCLTRGSTLRRAERRSTPSVIAWLNRGREWKWWSRALGERRCRSWGRCWLSWCRSGECNQGTRLLRAPRTWISRRRLYRPKSRLVFSALAVLFWYSWLIRSGADIGLAVSFVRTSLLASKASHPYTQ